MKSVLVILCLTLGSFSARATESLNSQQANRMVKHLLALQYGLPADQFHDSDSMSQDWQMNMTEFFKAPEANYSAPSASKFAAAFRKVCGSDDSVACVSKALAFASRQ